MAIWEPGEIDALDCSDEMKRYLKLMDMPLQKIDAMNTAEMLEKTKTSYSDFCIGMYLASQDA